MQKSIQQEKNVDEDDNFCYFVNRYSERTVSRITTKFETERWVKLMIDR